MKATIAPSKLKGNLRAPASKSSMQRACAASLLAHGTTVIQNPGHSNDDKAAINIIRALGAKAELVHEELVVTSKGLSPATNVIHCGESGLSIRMFSSIIALTNRQITITGSGSLLTRPMDFFDKIFPLLKVDIQSNNGKLPLLIKGPLHPANIEIDGTLSSQYLTGLLFAYSAASANNVTITVRDLKSRPYIDLTLDVMKSFGMKVPINDSYQNFYFNDEVNNLSEKERSYFVEGDWSGGAFLLVAGAISGPVLISGLDVGSSQADKSIIDALMAAGANIAFEAKGIRVKPSALYAFDFDATDCPDLFPPLVSLAAYCGGQSKIKGVGRLAHKESNRGITLQEEFAKMGVQIDIEKDWMIIHGGKGVSGSHVHSRHDHRIAMACAIAALNADGNTIIDDAEAINKSYPDFFSDLEKLGASVSLSSKISLHE